MWHDRRERKLPSPILRRRPAVPAKPKPERNTATGVHASNNTASTTKRLRVKPHQLAGPRPTFTGAQNWVQRHRGDIDTVVQLLDLYPNLIQAEGLDPLWDFLQPVLLDKGSATPSKTEAPREESKQLRKRSKGRNHRHAAHHHRTKSNRGSHPDGTTDARYVYVCDDIAPSESSPSGRSTRENIVTSLSSHCYVRTNPELPASKADFGDVLNAVSTADAFLFLMNDGSLSSWFCLHQLSIAVTYDIPIITVREAGYSLPENLPSDIHQVDERVKTSDGTLTTPVPPRRHHSGRSKSSDICQGARAKSESLSSGFHSDPEIVPRKPQELAVPSLSDVIRNSFQTSVLYVSNFHDSCIAKLFGRLSDYLGDIFLDAEISKTEKYQRARDLQSTDSDASDRLPSIKGGSVFRTLSSRQGSNDKLAERSPSSDGSHDPPDTPTSTEKSVATPISPFVKLPPIAGVVQNSEKTPMHKEPSQEEDVETIVNSSPPNCASLYVSPPSSPFLETRYLVFPGKTKGSSEKPYLVAFPGDVYGKESLGEGKDDPVVKRSDGESENEEDDMRFLNMDGEPSFDKINLDVQQDEVSEKSPFSTPLPSARKPRPPEANAAGSDSVPTGKEGRGSRPTKGLSPGDRPPKAAERFGRFRTQNGKIRGIELAERNKQTQITQPAKKYLRNNSDSWMPNGAGQKKNFKMAKVTLQYGPKGKLANPLI